MMRNITDSLSTRGFWLWKRKVPVPQVYIADSLSDFDKSRVVGSPEELKPTPESAESELFEYRGKAIVWFGNPVSFERRGERFFLNDGSAECKLMRDERGGLDMRWVDDESFRVPFSYVNHLSLFDVSVVYVPAKEQVFLRWGRQVEPPTLAHKAMFAMPSVECGHASKYGEAVNIPRARPKKIVRGRPYDGIVEYGGKSED